MDKSLEKELRKNYKMYIDAYFEGMTKTGIGGDHLKKEFYKYYYNPKTDPIPMEFIEACHKIKKRLDNGTIDGHSPNVDGWVKNEEKWITKQYAPIKKKMDDIVKHIFDTNLNLGAAGIDRSEQDEE